MGSFTMNHNYKIPKQPMGDDISIYLPFYGIYLVSDKTDLPSVKLIHIYKTKIGHAHEIGTIELDERRSTVTNAYSNYLNYEVRESPDPESLVDIFINKYRKLKKSNINYGNIGINPETENGYEYPGSEYLTVEKFFDYLKSENREQIINQII